MYIPAKLPRDFWQKMSSGLNNVRLMVKRVFITDDLGEEYMPRWLSFLRVTVDGNVSDMWDMSITDSQIQRTTYRESNDPTNVEEGRLMRHSLNVSRETLQNHRFLQQLQRILIRKAIDLFSRMASDDSEKYQEISKVYGNALRIGMLESAKDKVKLAKLLRFESTRTNYTSLEEVRAMSPFIIDLYN